MFDPCLLCFTVETCKVVITVKSNKIVVEHIPKALAEKFFSLMEQWELYKFKTKITGPTGGDIELLCIYRLYGPKIHKSSVRKLLKKGGKKSAMFFEFTICINPWVYISFGEKTGGGRGLIRGFDILSYFCIKALVDLYTGTSILWEVAVEVFGNLKRLHI